MVAVYAESGFSKIHLDASMACADDPVPLPEAVIAARATRLAVVAEKHAGDAKPVHVIGTEVPVPGGALDMVDHLRVTTPSAARSTVALHREAFAKAGISAAFDRVIGLVVQPGVQFGNENVVAYDPVAASALVRLSGELPMVFEAHSTDYQTPQVLGALVKDGFAILKVGPRLTFALRKALYGLDHIADHLLSPRDQTLRGLTKFERTRSLLVGVLIAFMHSCVASAKLVRQALVMLRSLRLFLMLAMLSGGFLAATLVPTVAHAAAIKAISTTPCCPTDCQMSAKCTPACTALTQCRSGLSVLKVDLASHHLAAELGRLKFALHNVQPDYSVIRAGPRRPPKS